MTENYKIRERCSLVKIVFRTGNEAAIVAKDILDNGP